MLCPKCGGEAERTSQNRYECPYCGEMFTGEQPNPQTQPQPQTQSIAQDQTQASEVDNSESLCYSPGKSLAVTIISCFIMGFIVGLFDLDFYNFFYYVAYAIGIIGTMASSGALVTWTEQNGKTTFSTIVQVINVITIIWLAFSAIYDIWLWIKY